ncbi:MAG TPA: hypothetical protein VGS97_19835 [Actinocrinis sp.]|uniref:hypothetical protein n=1 Tax=Actinocrinis sp. TaxID=1920516 RepID=UPI002DDD5D99|nr:hypothetical protein [Actinocrinis sp.]HEV2346361.1 hypothetical protein [Actinocrinis sp.]
MTRDEQIALLTAAANECLGADEPDVLPQGNAFATTAAAMKRDANHTPDDLDTQLYCAEHVQEYIDSVKLLKAVFG